MSTTIRWRRTLARVARGTVVALAAGVLATAAGRAQAVPQAEAAVAEFFRSLVERRWFDAARWLSLEHVEARRRAELNESGTWRPLTPPTVEDMMAEDSTLPRSVAEYQVKQFAKLVVDMPDRRPLSFARIDSLAQLARMPVEEAAVRWLEARDPVAMADWTVRALGCQRNPALDSTFRSLRISILGSVANGADRALVVFEAPAGAARASDLDGHTPAIAFLDATPDGWRILPRYDLFATEGFLRLEGCAGPPGR